MQWARKRLADGGKLGPKARVASDLVEVGDVVLVRQMTDDKTSTFCALDPAAGARGSGGSAAMDVSHRARHLDAGRIFYQSSVFNRATRHNASRVQLQALRLCGGAGFGGLYPGPTIVVDEPITLNTPQGLGRPKNASGKFYGPTPMRTGSSSRALMTIRIAQDIGMDTVANMPKFSVYDHLIAVSGNSLGAQETTLFKMVAAYAMFANGGGGCRPTLVDRVQDRYGCPSIATTAASASNCDQATLPGRRLAHDPFQPRTGDGCDHRLSVDPMMEGVVKRGSGRGVQLPVPVAGKRTTNDARTCGSSASPRTSSRLLSGL